MIIERQQLIELIGPHLRKTIALIAPAGYGKTTLLNQLIERSDQPHIHLRLDRFKQDISRFAVYLLDELRSSFKDEDLDILIDHLQRTDIKYAKDVFWNVERTIRRLYGNNILIALDDLHEVEADPEVYELVNTLIKNSGENVRFIYCSRKRPQLPAVEYLAVRGLHFEADVSDLRFSTDEIKKMLANTNVISKQVTLAALENATHGWPFILSLMVASDKRSDFLNQGNEMLSSAASDVLETFLFSEVFRPLPVKIQATLLKLWPFSAVELNDEQFCDLVGLTSVEVRGIKRTGLPIELDREKQVLVLHPLLRDFLREQFKRQFGNEMVYAQGIVDLFLSREAFDKAIDICLQLKLTEQALELMIRYADDLLVAGHSQFYENALTQIAVSGAIGPANQYLEAKLIYAKGNYMKAFEILKDVTEDLARSGQAQCSNRIYILALLDLQDINLWHGIHDSKTSEVFAQVRDVVESLDDNDVRAEVAILTFRQALCQGDWFSVLDQIASIEDLLSNNYQFSKNIQSRIGSLLTYIHMLFGEILIQSENFEGLIKTNGTSDLLVLNNIAILLLERGEYSSARRTYKQASKRYMVCKDRLMVPVILTTLLDILESSIDINVAKKAHKFILACLMQQNDIEGKFDLHISATNLCRRRQLNQLHDKHLDALRELNSKQSNVKGNYTTKIVILLNEARSDPGLENISKTLFLRDDLREKGLTLFDLQATYALAVIYDRKGDLDNWQTEFSYCLEKATKYQYHHFMIQEGCLYPKMYLRAAELDIHKLEALEYFQRMGQNCIIGLVEAFNSVDTNSKELILNKLESFNSKESVEALRKIQRTADPEFRADIKQRLSKCYGSHATEKHPQVAQHLTSKESEVLNLIATGLTNKEIATSLFISEKTLKTHINRVFFKMNVKNRADAIRIFQTSRQGAKPHQGRFAATEQNP